MPPPSPFSDHTYAETAGVPLALRLFPPTPAAVTSGTPWVLYLRGGAFSGWAHYLPHPWVVPGFRARGIPVVSAGYRLAPAVRLRDMLADVDAAYEWCLRHLGDLVGADPTRCIVVGESSGALVATLFAHAHRAEIRALVDVYGAVDLLAPRWQPSKYETPESEREALSGRWSEAEVAAAVRAAPGTRALTTCPFDDFPPLDKVADIWGVPDYEIDLAVWALQNDMRKWMCNTNRLTHIVSGVEDGDSEAEAAAKLRAVSPLHLLGTITKASEGQQRDFPPTAFLHGEADADVPLAQSQSMAARLRELGVPVLEVYKPGEGHVFDWQFQGPESSGWGRYIEPILDFTEKWARA